MPRTITLDQPTVSSITAAIKDYLANEVGIPDIKLSHVRHGFARGLGYPNANALSASLKAEGRDTDPVAWLLQPDTWALSGHVRKAVQASLHTDAEIIGEKAADHIIGEAVQGRATLGDLATLRWHAEMAVLAHKNGELADDEAAEERWRERAQVARAAIRGLVGANRLVRSARDVRPGDKVKDLYSSDFWSWQVVEEVSHDTGEIRTRLASNGQSWTEIGNGMGLEGVVILERARKGRSFDPATECLPPRASFGLLAERPASVRLPANGFHDYVGESSLARLRATLGEPATEGLLHPRAQIEWWLRFEDGAEAVVSARLPGAERYKSALYAPDALNFAVFPGDGVPLERIVGHLHAIVGTRAPNSDYPSLGGLRTDIDIVFHGGLPPVDLLESHLFWRAERLASPLPGRIRRYRVQDWESEPVNPDLPLRAVTAAKVGFVTPEWLFGRIALDSDTGHMDVTMLAADDADALATLAKHGVAAGETVLLVGTPKAKGPARAVKQAAAAAAANGATVWQIAV